MQNEQGNGDRIVLVEKKKTKWIIAGEIILFVACVVSSTAGTLSILSDRDTQSDVQEMERKFEELKTTVNFSNETRIAYEAATQNKLSKIEGRLEENGQTDIKLELAGFVEEVRKEAQLAIKEKEKGEL